MVIVRPRPKRSEDSECGATAGQPREASAVGPAPGDSLDVIQRPDHLRVIADIYTAVADRREEVPSTSIGPSHLASSGSNPDCDIVMLNSRIGFPRRNVM